MHRLAAQHDAAREGLASCADRMGVQECTISGVQPDSALSRIASPSRRRQRHEGRAAQLARRFRERRQHRLQIEGRTADDLEHIGGRGLLLQRFLEVARLRLHLVEQARVLDRDDGLVGEGLDELDLLVVERAEPRCASRRARRSARRRASSECRDRCGVRRLSAFARPVFGVGLDVLHVNGSAFQHSPPADRAPLGHDRHVVGSDP